ncbi:GntR family transcriptional regulator [Actinosynnema sp. NPDC047251]|uniref:Transcriptional regulator, GntR family n=1 Tax=Saccharothrix espanaensis (strain ATCC 51144 / DSM 44229 / JCM 9112 / NBRC 15066 / NRRL 15764) TaxID=1179773 RepID=K0K6M5_SACES|nr:GntR family transcriptional regulator [Saccharothrix espanaensis]CCH32549.1 Transcriptional regulator, GntR family [Saccharothrix espanaensis DSM 44229]
MPDLDAGSLPDRVHRLLRTRILNNELAAGTRLLEVPIAEELGVSRTTLRLALTRLADEGLIEISPRRHSIVTRLSHDDIQDACYARYVLEEGAVRAVLAHGTADLVDPLTDLVDRMDHAARAGDLAAVVDLDTAFHGRLVAAARKPRLAKLFAGMDAQMGAVMRSSLEEQHLALTDMPALHRDLVDALAGGDPTTVATTLYRHYLRDDYVL